MVLGKFDLSNALYAMVTVIDPKDEFAISKMCNLLFHPEYMASHAYCSSHSCSKKRKMPKVFRTFVETLATRHLLMPPKELHSKQVTCDKPYATFRATDNVYL